MDLDLDVEGGDGDLELDPWSRAALKDLPGGGAVLEEVLGGSIVCPPLMLCLLLGECWEKG